MVKIYGKDEPVLREIAAPVLVGEISGKKIQHVLADMKEALNSQDDGVAICAPQIGQSLRIFVVSGRVFGELSDDPETARAAEQAAEAATLAAEKAAAMAAKASGKSDISRHTPAITVHIPDRIFINPEIVKTSKKTEWMEEGCLSLRYLYGKVRRAVKTRVRAYDEHGKKFELGGAGLLSQIFQHEIDHLDGVIFTDKARDVKDLPPDGIKMIEKTSARAARQNS